MRTFSIKSQEKRRDRALPKITSKIPVEHLGYLKRVEIKNGKYDSHQSNKQQGISFIKQDGMRPIKQAHVSPLNYYSKINNIVRKSKSKGTKAQLKHIVPSRWYNEIRNGKEAKVSNVIAKKTRLPIAMSKRIISRTNGKYNGWKRTVATEMKSSIAKRNQEPINPVNIVPRHALHQIEAREQNNGEAYEAEMSEEPDDNMWTGDDASKNEVNGYDKAYRRQQKDEGPKRRWEDDEEEEEHHHHENMTEHSSFEHRLTEKLLDAILSEHGKHENTEPKEHPNLGIHEMFLIYDKRVKIMNIQDNETSNKMRFKNNSGRGKCETSSIPLFLCEKNYR